MTTAIPSPASTTASPALAPLPDVIEAIRTGQPVLVLDDAGRENEADLVCAADGLTPAVMALLIREAAASCACASSRTRPAAFA